VNSDYRVRDIAQTHHTHLMLYIHIYTYIYMCVYTYTHIYIYVCTYIHIQKRPTIGSYQCERGTQLAGDSLQHHRSLPTKETCIHRSLRTKETCIHQTRKFSVVGFFFDVYRSPLLEVCVCVESPPVYRWIQKNIGRL